MGAWMHTDAFMFGMTSADRLSGAAQMKIAGPHFQTPANGVTDALNLSYFHVYMPSKLLMTTFGLRPNEANAQTLPVTRTVGAATTVPITEYVPVEGGLLIQTSGIGFSTPLLSVRRVLVVKKNKKITADTIIRAAGVSNAKQFGKIKILVNKKNGMKASGRHFVFSKTRSILVTVIYKPTKRHSSTREVKILVRK